MAKGKRNVIVGEPGIGKTELMKKIMDTLESGGNETKLISFRSLNAVREIDNFLNLKTGKPKVLLLDAFDETPLTMFSPMLKKIQEISKKQPDLAIYISSRWIFMEKYANSFAEYRFIAIKPFTNVQVKDYLIARGYNETDVEELTHRMMQFHGRIIIQIPRYLFLLESFMQGRNLSDVYSVSRNELFEYFIYSKLELEATKNEKAHEMVPIIKRLLEKLALVMEIYQTNTITREELVTFFDDLKSDIKLVVLTQVSIDVLLKNSVLQTSATDTDKLEFENAEFQEYLAAKEITRFPEPPRTAFSFAADKTLNEIYPSWYNTLSFLIDMEPDMLGQLLDFSGIKGEEFKVADEAFFSFLSRVNPSFTPNDIKARLFIDVISYHNTKLQWIPRQLSSALPGFYSNDLETFLKEEVGKAEQQVKTEAKYYIPIANVAYTIAYLLRSNVEIDRPYWREKLTEYASEQCENSVLPRHALLALSELGDPTVIEELPDLTQGEDELVIREFVSMCAKLDPNNQRSVNAFLQLTRADDLHGRFGLFEVTQVEALKYFLSEYNKDDLLRKEFLNDSFIFNDKDHIIVNNIRESSDSEMRNLATEAIIKSLHYSTAHTRGKSTFISGLMSFLREKNPRFIPDIIKHIRNADNGERNLYFAQDFFVDLLTKEDVVSYIDAMLETGEHANSVMNTLIRIKLKGTETSDAIYEAGRARLTGLYREYEEARARPIPDHDTYDERIITEFRTALEPARNQYMTRVFHDYISNADKLEELMSDIDRNRLDSLIKNEALRHNPATTVLTINSETNGGASRNYTTNGAAIIFGDALVAAHRRGIDVTPYRSNIAYFIPFAHNEQLKTVFELIPDFSPEELNPVIDIYAELNTDLWRWQPDAFIAAAEQYNLVQAVPILRNFVHESSFREDDRIESLSVAESLQSDAKFLQEIFQSYLDSKFNSEQNIAIAANALLITKHNDPDAVNWRLEQVEARIVTSSKENHGLDHGKEFAIPLMEIKQEGLEDDYLALIDKALEIWAQGEDYHAYAQYLWGITYAYFDNLKEYKDYRPLQQLEEKISSVGSKKTGANWLGGRMVQLRRSYLEAIGKPPRISEAIRRYNIAHEYDDKQISNSSDLFRHLHDAIDIDLRNWIEGEGAYELILTGKIYDSKKQEYEKLIQKTLKAQIENIMLKRGFQVDLLREPDLLDDKRVDLLIRYGFVGPVVVEIKLTSNSDIKVRDVAASKSYKSMEHYMRGYGSSHGIFLIIVNSKTNKIPTIEETFRKIKGVTTMSLDCYKFSPPKKRKSNKAKGTKKTVGKTTKSSRRRKKKL